VGSSHVIVSAAKWAMTCVSGNGLVCGLEFWYQSISGDTSIVIVWGSLWAAMRTQWRACCRFVVL
jgi:hypothetical protein